MDSPPASDMTPLTTAARGDFPDDLAKELRPDEQVHATFRPDLDRQLRFYEGVLVLTSQRLLSRTDPDTNSWTSLPIEQATLETGDHAGLGRLTLHVGGRPRALWHYTLPRAADAQAFARVLSGETRPPARASEPPTSEGPRAPEPSAPLRRSPLLRVLAFAFAHRSMVLLGLLLTLGTTAVGLIPPYLTMPLVDEVLVPYQGAVDALTRAAGGTSAHDLAALQARARGSFELVPLYLGALLAAAILAWLLAWAQGAVLAKLSERISAELRNRTFSHLQTLSLDYFGGKRTGDLISRISSDTDRLCGFLSDTLVDFVTDVLMILGTAIVLVSLDPILGAATLISFPPIAWLVVRLRHRLTHGFLRGGRAWSEMTNILADTIPGIRVVKAFSQEHRENERFRRANERILQVNDRVNAIWTMFWPLVGLLNQIGLLVVWAVGAWRVFHNHVTVGALTAFVAYIARFYARLERMSRMITATQRASASAQRLFEILDREPSVADRGELGSSAPVLGRIAVQNASFRYGSRLVLDGVSLEIEPGEMIGIVGQTGSGKTTLANLICRFYDVSSGAIEIDGVDLRERSLTHYRRHLGIVLQEPFLFFGTIAENVAYGRSEASPSAIIEAARAARAHEFVLRLPEAYDSLVGERGQSLSGGERQRISIARAILIDPRILILDEATSAVDPETEREIQRALDNLTSGRTTLAIAHRLSTLRKADRLLVLRDGRVVETGTHAELLARGGEYATLFRAQPQATPALENTLPSARTVAPLRDIESLHFEHDLVSGLSARDAAGQTFDGLLPVRCFPLTSPNSHVCVIDAKGRELVHITDVSRAPVGVRTLIERELERREFIPVLERIDRVITTPTRSEWEVRTNRGAARFAVDNENNVRRLAPGRFLITDTRGMRFLVEDIERLDPASQRWLRSFD